MDANSIITKLLYKKDAYTDDLRISKTKIISLLIFVLLFLLFMLGSYADYGYIVFEDILISIVVALIFTLPIFVIGWLIGYFIDNNTYKTRMLNEQQNANAQQLDIGSTPKQEEAHVIQQQEIGSTPKQEEDIKQIIPYSETDQEDSLNVEEPANDELANESSDETPIIEETPKENELKKPTEADEDYLSSFKKYI